MGRLHPLMMKQPRTRKMFWRNVCCTLILLENNVPHISRPEHYSEHLSRGFARPAKGPSARHSINKSLQATAPLKVLFRRFSEPSMAARLIGRR